MVSQFVSVENVRLLGDLDFDFPEGTHAIGRLDNLSEGLLLLSTNKRITKLLFQGKMLKVRIPVTAQLKQRPLLQVPQILMPLPKIQSC